MTEKRKDEVTGEWTTGHAADGIEELNTPLPRWWQWTFYATIVWGLIYTIFYPAWPLISGATQGVFGYSSRGEYEQKNEVYEELNAAIGGELVQADLNNLDPASDLYRYAVARGRSVFLAHCSQCHGSGAAGTEGYPNLLDNDWLWGGSFEEISYSVRHGIRNQTDDDARYSEMPKFGSILSREEIDHLVAHVKSLTQGDESEFSSEEGQVLFSDNCASCHGEDGKGDRELGAPNLADAIWLYGSDEEDIVETISNARFGVMPAWGQRLSEADVRAVSAYVHALGGGE